MDPKKPLKPTSPDKFPNGRDPETGLVVKADGALHGSTGSGPRRKYTPIPPADMPELVKNGLAPELIPNWNPKDPNSNWQCGFRKFTPERRAIFLEKLELTGRIRLAARFAGVTHATIHRHREADPQFAAACEEAEAMYHETVAASITHQARVGMIDERYDKDGRMTARRVTYEQQIRGKMLDRADERYKHHSRQDIAVVGGAVVVPAPTDSVETWDDIVRKYTQGSTAPTDVGASSNLSSAIVQPALLGSNVSSAVAERPEEMTGEPVDGVSPVPDMSSTGNDD